MESWRTFTEPREKLSEEAIEAFGAEAKVGLLATVNPEGRPHLTLITSIMARTETELMWGQFAEGKSKEHVRLNPRTGFMVLTTDRKIWRGKAKWTGDAKTGPEFEMYNNQPMFRYNAYFGIHTVHFMDLEVQYGKEGLPIPKVAIDVLKTGLFRYGAKRKKSPAVFNAWTRSFLSNPATLKFLAYVDLDGFPKIIPVLGLMAADSGRLVFSPEAWAEDIAQIPRGSYVAVFGLSFQMEDVLVRGRFWGVNRHLGARLGTIDADWVYNSMPPAPGQIYPEIPVTPVTDF